MSDKKTVYTLFDEFLGRFKERKSLFSDKQVFTDNNLGKIVNEYIINSDEREDINFLTKLFDQLKSDESKEIMANALWIWSFTVGDITIKTKEKYLTDLGINKDQLKGHLLPQEETILHAGQYHKTNKFKEIKFLLALFQWLIKIKEDAIGKLKESIIEYIEMDRKNADEIEIKSNKSIAIQNILLHLCTPSEYEPIANYNHKKSIVDTFQKLIDETKKDSSVDKKIEIIKQKLTEEFEIKLDNGFYSDPIRSFWDFNGIETNTILWTSGNK